jgi:N utilization substance protein B
MNKDFWDSQNLNDFLDIDPQDVVESEVVEHDKAATERSTARRIALQVLYEVDSAHHDVGTVITTHLAENEVSRKALSYLRRLVTGVIANRQRLDEVIQQYAPEWPLDQVAIIDRNILRMALFELAVQARTPIRVAIDEAVALARLFGADGATRFVNGVLGSLADDIDALRQQLATPDGESDE